MKQRQFTDSQLKALANVFHVDTGGAFEPITEEEVAAKAEAIFPQAKREEAKAKLNAELERLFRKGATA